MDQNIKNTLYRFVTMRVPQAIEKNKKADFFVSSPIKESENEFHGLVPDSEEARNITSNYAVTYRTVDQLKTKFGSLYDYAIWLTRNRKTVTLEEADSAFTEAEIPVIDGVVIDRPTLTSLWNDLHYYSLVQTSSIVRDEIISILVANEFYNKVIAKDDESLTPDFVSGVAQARVIIELKPMLRLYTVQSSANSKKRTVSIEEERKHAHLKASLNAKDLNTYKKEISKAREVFELKQSRIRTQAGLAYQNAITLAYKNATYVERVVTDKETGQTAVVKEYENLVLPDYSDHYKRPEDELVFENPTSYISADTIAYIEQLKSEFAYLTFDEVSDHLNKEMEENELLYLANNPKPKNVVVFQGVPFSPQTSVSSSDFISTSSSLKVSFLRHSGSASYSIFIENLKADWINSATYGIVQNKGVIEGKIEGTSYKSSYGDTVQLFGKMIPLTDEPVSIKGSFKLASGDTIIFETEDVSLNELAEGIDVPFEIQDRADNPIGVAKPKIHGLTQLGIADYRKVEQEVCCYVPGEVSHIENIMAREYKSRSNTRRKLTEITETSIRESESEQLTDTTTTDRFEMNQEIGVISSQATAIGVNAGVHYGNETMGGYVDGSFANNTSVEESNHQAATHAKEVTERALERVVQKVKEERIEKVIEEFTDSYVHEFDNTKGNNHVSGVYRWVDKVYKNKLINYGKRLMYEFMVPEPSSFHNEAILLISPELEQIPPPVDPRHGGEDRLLLSTDMEDFPSRAKYWASYYNAEINPLPDQNIVLGREITQGNADGGLSADPKPINHEGPSSVRAKLELPEDYTVFKVDYYFVTSPPHEGRHNYVRLLIGNDLREEGVEWVSGQFSFYPAYNRGTLPISFTGWDIGGFALNLTIHCQLSYEAMQKWKYETFNAIISKYEEAKKAYDEKMAGLVQETTEKIQLNPGFYRKIEQDVLRKNCMAYLLTEKGIGKGFIGGRTQHNDTGTIHVTNTLPMEKYAATVKFFEQAFEWDIMSYYFYPFYWAEKNTWSEKYQIQNNDPLFRAFMQSGMARVIVTVRPGFEEAVNWYLATGQVWNGGQVPVIDDENFLDIVAELREPEGEVEEVWETRVPTSLTVIQAGTIGLDVEGLPCNPECGGDGFNPIGQTDNNLNDNDPKENLVEFIYQGLDNGRVTMGNDQEVTIGVFDEYNYFPRMYECMGETITINRDASWNNEDSTKIIYEMLAQQVSQIDGLKAAQFNHLETGAPDGIRFTIDVFKVPHFKFIKNLVTHPEIDERTDYTMDTIEAIYSPGNIKIIESGGYERVLDKNEVPLKNEELGTLLPINRFKI